MKTSAGLLSLAFVFALPAAAQRATSSGGSHSSSGTAGGSSSRGSASSGSSSSTGNHSARSTYATSSSSGGGGSAPSSGSGAQASGRYVGNAPVQRQAPIGQRGYSPAHFIGSLTIRTAAPIVRASAPVQMGRRGPYLTYTVSSEPSQGSVFPFRQGFNGGFHHSFCGSPLGFDSGFESLNCFGNSFSSPFISPFGRGYGAGPYYARGNYGYTSGDQAADESSDYEPPSAPGTYMPDALTPAQPEETPAPLPVTLLALKDGTMYGVTDYWLEQGQLHYVASYGGQNSVPLDRVDIGKTVELNSANGLGFNLRSAPAARPNPGPSIKLLSPAAVPDLPF